MTNEQLQQALGTELAARFDRELWKALVVTTSNVETELRKAYTRHVIKQFPWRHKNESGWERNCRNFVDKLPPKKLRQLAEPLFPELLL